MPPSLLLALRLYLKAAVWNPAFSLSASGLFVLVMAARASLHATRWQNTRVLVLGGGPVFIPWEWGPGFVKSSVDGLRLCVKKMQILRFDPQ